MECVTTLVTLFLVDLFAVGFGLMLTHKNKLTGCVLFCACGILCGSENLVCEYDSSALLQWHPSTNDTAATPHLRPGIPRDQRRNDDFHALVVVEEVVAHHEVEEAPGRSPDRRR